MIDLLIKPVTKLLDKWIPDADTKQKTAYEIRLSLVGSEMCIRDRYWASSGAFQSEQLTALINNVSPYYVVIGNDFQAALDACGLTKVVVEQII